MTTTPMPDTSRATAAAPVPDAPTDGAVVPLDAVTFRWTAPPGAAAFDLRVAAADAPGDTLVELATLPTTETTLADALPAGDLVWWVRQSGGVWSPSAAFRAGTPADVETARQLDAEAAREARATPADPLATPPPDPVWPHAEGDALDGALAPEWSSVPGFEAPRRADVELVSAAPPRVVSPLGGEVVDAVAVSLRWTDVPGATAYEVELSPHAAFDRDVMTIDAGEATEIGLPGLVPALGWKLLWRVRARTAEGATAWSRYGRFYPAGGEARDAFRQAFDQAVAAQRRQREHARLVRERELDLLPTHEREDAVTTSATLVGVVGVTLSGLVILTLAVVYAFWRGMGL